MNPVRLLLPLLASASLSATAASLNLGLYQTVTMAGQSTLKKVDTTQPGQTLRQVAVAQTDKPLNTPRATIPSWFLRLLNLLGGMTLAWSITTLEKPWSWFARGSVVRRCSSKW